MTILGMILPLALAALSPVLGCGWLGHGVYKLALFALPYSGGRRLATMRIVDAVSLVRSLVTGVALGFVGLGLATMTADRLWDPDVLRAALDARFGYTPALAIVAAIVIATANAVLEEWFYRGWLDGRAGMPASAITFGAQHFIVLSPLVGALPALAAGTAVVPAALAWSLLARRDGWAFSAASHIAADVVLFAGGLVLLGYWS